jgi:hypothetical protein
MRRPDPSQQEPLLFDLPLVRPEDLPEDEPEPEAEPRSAPEARPAPSQGA